MSVDTTFEENPWFSDLFGLWNCRVRDPGPDSFVGCGKDEIKRLRAPWGETLVPCWLLLAAIFVALVLKDEPERLSTCECPP